MIDRSYCVLMARYNAWQNNQLMAVVKDMPAKDLTKDRKAFFGSILGTLNHLIWGDHIWMSRFDGGTAPTGDITNHTNTFPTAAVWSAERFRMDGRIKLWAEQVRSVDLQGDLTWFSGAMQKEFTAPMSELVVQMFNHQTHHRGQVHAMLTAAGQKAPVTDIPFMPKDA